jgi:carbon storage regulator
MPSSRGEAIFSFICRIGTKTAFHTFGDFRDRQGRSAALSDLVCARPIITEDATMLVLSRKVGQAICLDHDIEVVVTAIHGNRVTLGISAPKSIAIRRAELPQSRDVYCEEQATHETRRDLIPCLASH